MNGYQEPRQHRSFLRKAAKAICELTNGLSHQQKVGVLRALGGHAGKTGTDELFNKINEMSTSLGDDKWPVLAELVTSFSRSSPRTDKVAKFDALLDEATMPPFSHGKALFLSNAATRLDVVSQDPATQLEKLNRILDATDNFSSAERATILTKSILYIPRLSLTPQQVSQVAGRILHLLSNAAVTWEGDDKIQVLHVLAKHAAIDQTGNLFNQVATIADTLDDGKWLVRSGLIENFSKPFNVDKQARFEAFFADFPASPSSHGEALFLAKSAEILPLMQFDADGRFAIFETLLNAAGNFSGRDKVAILKSAISGINLIGIGRERAETVMNSVLDLAEGLASADQYDIYLAVMNAQMPAVAKPQELLDFEQRAQQWAQGGIPLMLPDHEAAMWRHHASAGHFQLDRVSEKVSTLDSPERATLFAKLIPKMLERWPIAERFRNLRQWLEQKTTDMSSADMRKVLTTAISGFAFLPEDKRLAAFSDVLERTHALDVADKSQVLAHLNSIIAAQLRESHHDTAREDLKLVMDTLPGGYEL